MLDKIKIIYKGDIITSFIYLGVGLVMILIASLLYYFTHKLGYYYLSLGMALLAVYSLAKGFILNKVARNRYAHYKDMKNLASNVLDEEYEYTNYRLMKKEGNRRRYAWTFGIASVIAVIGVFMQEKGLVIGTMIPIVLYASIEFSIGLLVEFRLWEFHRMLKREKGMLEDHE